MLPVLMLCGCSQAEQKKNEDAEGMLYLEATGSGEINENRFTVERKDFVTDMEYEASLVASFYSEIYMPEKKASYSVAKLVKKDGDFYSAHLQTGSLTYDIPKDSEGFWPFGKYEQAKFMHKYGYYEI